MHFSLRLLCDENFIAFFLLKIIAIICSDGATFATNYSYNFLRVVSR